MKTIIFGATGSLGKQLVLQSLALGHQVTAFARTPEKLKDIQHPALTIHQGDVMNAASVAAAVVGQDAVFCALGSGRKGKVRAEGTKNIIRAMENAKTKRLICETTLGAGDSAPNLNFFWKNIMFGFFLKDAYIDHQEQENYIQQSGLNWTIIRPAAFTNGTVTGQYKHGFGPDAKGLQLKISRADVAHFMLSQLDDTGYIRKTPGLSY